MKDANIIVVSRNLMINNLAKIVHLYPKSNINKLDDFIVPENDDAMHVWYISL